MGYNFASDMVDVPLLKTVGIGKTAAYDVRVIDQLYYKHDTGFGVYLVETDGRRRFTATGVFITPLAPNHCYYLSGKVLKRDQEYQLDVKEYKSTFPTDEFGILSVLGTLEGLNTHAAQVYAKLGKDALLLIHDDPHTVAQLLGIDPSKPLAWQRQLMSGEEMDEVVSELLEMGLNMTQARKLVEQYGLEIAGKMKQDPYFLTATGTMPFTKCDQIALNHGTPINSIFRVSAAMLYALKQAAFADGDCCLEKDDFFERVRAVVGLFRALSNVYMGFDFLTALNLPSQVYNMLPYIISLVVLAFTSGKSRAPKAEGIPYDKGQR